ncbi:OmpA family protein [Methylophilus sp. 5]|uniref:OmpA family protein n=1 Tax=Methylophilus sp. 5 TaxID=1112274 RepID=UPI00048E2C9B|nr:OmpA family protein [Methylophilus sp. 5]
MNLKLKPLPIMLITALSFQGCATKGPNGESRSFKETFKETFNSDDPCSNSKRNVGIALGAAGGVLVAVLTGDKNSLGRAVVGGIIGAGLGGLIGHEIGNRQCEISKIQKKYDAEIQMTPLALPVESNKTSGSTQTTSNGSNPQMLANNKTQEIGLSVAVVDKAGGTQFESDSDVLQPKAREMFLEIAKTYTNPEKMFEAKADKEKKDIEKAFNDRRILLVGHTDDTGSTLHNAELSERRAKVIAKLFKEAGVPEDKVFYQGAGETMPVADNDTPEGRAKNRRVEILDLSNEQVFDMYLVNRRPNTAYYRSAAKGNSPSSTSAAVETAMNVEAPLSVAVSNTSKKTKTAVTTNKKTSKSPTVQASAQPKQKVASGERFIDFEGKPFSESLALVSTGMVETKKSSSFSLISEARASDMQSISTCNVDRPRSSGAVKSLKDGLAYKTAEYMPGMYGRTWADMVGKNLVVLNKVSVLREGLVPGNKPELKVYSNYKSSHRDQTPDVFINPDVNTYQTTNGLLYRVFANGDHGIQCMDILMPVSNATVAKDGKLIYGNGAAEFVSDFKPKIKS